MKKPFMFAAVILGIFFLIAILFLYQKNAQVAEKSAFPEEQSCAKAGEFASEKGTNLVNKQCCKNLDMLLNTPFYSATRDCNEILQKSDGYICIDCGNKICESWENRCNCPLDCESFNR